MAFLHRRATTTATTATPSSAPSAPGWTHLPALQRVVEPIAPIAPREPFVASLASHHSPSFLAPLAHVIDPDGPSGRIAGLITPAAPAPVPPVQRSAQGEGSIIKRFIGRPRSTPVITSAAPVQREAADDSAPPPAVEVYAEPEPAVVPASEPEQVEVRLPEPASADAAAPSPDATIQSTAMPTPSTTPPLASAPVAQTPVQRVADVAAANPPALVRPPSVAPLTRAVRPVPAAPTTAAPTTAAVQRAAVADAPSASVMQPAPEFGHSAPPLAQRAVADTTPPVVLDRIADTAPEAQPAATLAASPEPRSSEPRQPMVQRHRDNGTTADPAPVQRTVTPVSGPAPPMPAPAMTLPAPRSDTAPHQPAAVPPDLASEPVPVAVPAEQSSPLLGATDEVLSMIDSPAPAPVQRADAASAPTFTLPVPPSAVQRSHRSTPAEVPVVQTARPLGFGPPLTSATPTVPSAEAATQSAPVSPVSLSQWTAGRAAPTAVQRAVVHATHELTAPVFREPQTVAVLGERLPDIATAGSYNEPATAVPMPHQPIAAPLRSVVPPTPAVQRTLGMGAPLPAAPATMTAPIRQLQREISAERSPAPSYWDAGSVAVAAGIAQRGPHGSVEFGAAPFVQRDADDAPTAPEPAAAPEPAPTPAPAAAPAQAAAPAAAPAGGQNIDELVRRLYDPLAARLKAELRLDRERAGLVTDLRRP